MINSPIRFQENPLITADAVIPSRSDFRVEGVFNCGAVRFGDEILLLCRVAESAPQADSGMLGIPLLDEDRGFSEACIRVLDREDPLYDFSDSRSVAFRENGRTACLTTLSHLRLARSSDGKKFSVDSEPFLFPKGRYEAWGVEDPRITRIDDTYFITYSSASSIGVSASLVSTQNFQNIRRHGVILPPSNKDVMLFPEKINDRYMMLHRPCPTGEGPLNIWIAESENLTDWGKHRLVYSGKFDWEEERIGGGAPPIRTEHGWLCIHHGADIEGRYAAGALLLDISDPGIVLASTPRPLLSPEASYESDGFYGSVVFPCGALPDSAGVTVYYGGADDKVCGAGLTWDTIWNALDI